MAENMERIPSCEERQAQAFRKIVERSAAIREYEAVSWERLPEIDLYMDQVITYLGKQLSLFQRNESTKLLTSSMINNYVKDGLLPRPDHKRYSRDHLASLIVICMLKQVLSIPDVALLLKGLQKDTEIPTLHDQFCSQQKDALQSVCGRVEEATQKGKPELMQLALTLSIEANARRIAAERILSSFAEEPK